MREELDRPTFRRIMSDPSRLLLVSNPRSIWYHWIDYRFRLACHRDKKEKIKVYSLSLWLCSQSIFLHSISSKLVRTFLTNRNYPPASEASRGVY